MSLYRNEFVEVKVGDGLQTLLGEVVVFQRAEPAEKIQRQCRPTVGHSGPAQRHVRPAVGVLRKS